MKKLNIITVCGFGIGSSLILKMTVDNVLARHGIEADTEPHDVTSVCGDGVDLLLTSQSLYEQVKDKVCCPVILIENFISEQEVEEKVVEVARTMANQ